MIRINLLPHKEARKRKSGRQQIVIFVAVLVLEIGLLFIWQNSLSASLEKVRLEERRLRQDISKFEKQIQARKRLQRQRAVLKKRLDVLKAVELPGPENLLLYLAYVMRPPDQISEVPGGKNKDQPSEKGMLRGIGWKVDWDPRNIYLSAIKEGGNNSLTIDGNAKSLPDVAELINRLNDSGFFLETLLQTQKFKKDSKIKMRYVQFRLKCKINYGGYLKGPKKPKFTKRKG